MESMAFLVIGQKHRAYSFGKRRTAVRWPQAPWRWRESRSGCGYCGPDFVRLVSARRGSGTEYDLDAVIFLVGKDLVAFRRLVEPHPMRYDYRRINFAIRYFLEQRAHVPVRMRLPHFEG